MSYQEPLNINNIDFNNIIYPKYKTSQNKKIILLKYNDRKIKNFVFQTPTLFNILKARQYNSYSEIEVALTGKKESKINNFIEFLNKLENKIKDDAKIHFAEWFNINKEVKTINFQKIIRESDEHENGTIKLKIMMNSDFKTCIQINNKKINIQDIPEESWCKMLLECYAIWINSNNDFGLFLRPVLISFSPKEIYNYKFIEESDEEINVPDTEINNNIFMKINNNSKYNNQLEINELLTKLENQTSDSKLNINNIQDTFFNDSSNNSINIDNKYLDAETSE